MRIVRQKTGMQISLRTIRLFIFQLIIFFFLFSINSAIANDNKKTSKLIGTIYGKIVDETTQSPLPSVNVMIVGTQKGAAADFDGNFIVERVPAGTYNLRFQMMGYEMRIVSNVVVTAGRKTF